MQNVEIGYRNVHTFQGEAIARCADASPALHKAFTWPSPDKLSGGIREREPLVIRVAGRVAGRAVLETEYYTLCRDCEC